MPSTRRKAANDLQRRDSPELSPHRRFGGRRTRQQVAPTGFRRSTPSPMASAGSHAHPLMGGGPSQSQPSISSQTLVGVAATQADATDVGHPDQRSPAAPFASEHYAVSAKLAIMLAGAQRTCTSR